MDPDLANLARMLIDEPEWECPGISIHPGRPTIGCQQLDWATQSLGSYRVLEHTCACLAVMYELVSCGGVYQIHRVTQGVPPVHAFTGRWTHREARGWWQRLLIGQAR